MYSLCLCEHMCVCVYVLFTILHAQKGDTNVGSFIRSMALCHTVIPEQKGGKLDYRASSPGKQHTHYHTPYHMSCSDEGALVKAASNLGVMFTSRTPSTLTIEVVSVL